MLKFGSPICCFAIPGQEAFDILKRQKRGSNLSANKSQLLPGLCKNLCSDGQHSEDDLATM